MMLQVIEVGSEAYNELLKNVVKTTIDACRQHLKNEDDLITQEQAMVLLKVKSKQKMKSIREHNMIKWCCVGGVFLYSKKSILELVERK